MKSLLLKRIIYLSFIIFLVFPTYILIINLNAITFKNFNNSEILKTSGYISDLNPSLIPEFNFTDLNETWYDHDVEMIIITPDDENFINATIPLRDWKNQKGVKTIILSNFSSYPGRDDPERIRNMIKEYYEKEGIRWVLLVGDAENSLIPIRYVYNPDVDDAPNGPHPEHGDRVYKPTDFYYADLTGTWDDDNDNNFGESPIYNAFGIDEINWIPEVYVGRLPASNYIELQQMVNKTIKYESDPYIDDWMNNMLLAGVISDTVIEASPDGEDEARLTEYIWKNYVEPEMNFTHLYRSTYFSVNTSVDPSDTVDEISDASEFNNEFNSGYSTIMFAGHGDTGLYSSRGVGFSIYTDTQASSSSNADMPSLIYADACTTSAYDDTDQNIGEILIKATNSGAIGYIGALRVTWYIVDDFDFEFLNRANAKLFWEKFFEDKIYQQGKTLYDSKLDYVNSDIFAQTISSMSLGYQRKNVLTYCLLGDPEVDIYTNKPVNASNPFTGDIYEGQLVSITIRDTRNNIVPHARIHLTTEDGKYNTVYADINGIAKFRVYPNANEKYNVTITGHNLIPSHFNFTTKEDNIKPVISSVFCDKINPTTLDNICFDIFASDNRSGIESAIVLIQDKISGTYTYDISRNTLYENNTLLQVLLNKMMPGFYEFTIITRDYANNTQFYSQTFEFLIPIPSTYIVLIGGTILISFITGLSIVIVIRGINQHSSNLKRLKE